MHNMSPELTTMIQAAKEAGALLVERQTQSLPLILKGEDDFATQADEDAQKVIVDILRAAFPDIPIVAEEQNNPVIDSPTYFTVDPLDNTKPYKAGFPRGWGSIIGYVKDTRVQAGVVCLPLENELWVAERDKGCFLNGQSRKLNYTTSLRRAVIGIEMGPWLDEHCYETVVKPLTNASGMLKSCESVVGVDAIRGQLGLWIFVRGDAKKAGGIWDFTAPTLLIEEAGGIACTPQGTPLTFDRIDMNGIVYAASKEILSEALPLMKNW
jgi:myo-inositol-1(or 4)-monophosphatase